MNVKKTLFYFAYWVAAILFFIWCLFPAEEAAMYLSNRIEAATRNISITIDRVNPGFPVAVKMEGIHALISGDIAVRSDFVRVKPDYVSLARFKPGVKIFSDAYGGRITGNAILTSSKEKYYSVSGKARGLSVNELSELASPYLPEGYSFSGTVDVTGQYAKEKGDTGDAKISVNGFRIKLDKPVFTISELLFDHVEADLELKGKNAKITSMKIDGREVDGTLKGNIRVLFPLSRSTLNLTGTLTPDVVFMREFGKKVPLGLLTGGKKQKKGGFSFRIKGTVGKPRFSLK